MDSGANFSVGPPEFDCISSIPSRSVFIAWTTVYVLFLPVFLFVLYIGFNKRKKPQSSSSGGLSHSDVFTLHTVAMEMISIIGAFVCLYGYFALKSKISKAGGITIFASLSGQKLFHVLTCVERYLAVVHPVTYLRLRREGGVTIRNISIALVWLLSVVYNLPSAILNSLVLYGISGFLEAFIPLPLVSYCSVCVLRVLIRPKPGDGGGVRKQVAQSKRSTVYTMVAILGVLLLRLSTNAVNDCMSFWRKVDICLLTSISLFFTLPSSLVLPLLFLHRAGKLSKAGK